MSRTRSRTYLKRFTLGGCTFSPQFCLSVSFVKTSSVYNTVLVFSCTLFRILHKSLSDLYNVIILFVSCVTFTQDWDTILYGRSIISVQTVLSLIKLPFQPSNLNSLESLHLVLLFLHYRYSFLGSFSYVLVVVDYFSV